MIRIYGSLKKTYLLEQSCTQSCSAFAVHLVETAKLSALFESLLTNHNLNTVVAATMENIQPRAGDNIKDFTAINMWYERLDERYNFSLGSNILPLMTTDNVIQLETLDPPFMKEIKAMINDTQHGNLSSLYGKKFICKCYCLFF